MPIFDSLDTIDVRNAKQIQCAIEEAVHKFGASIFPDYQDCLRPKSECPFFLPLVCLLHNLEIHRERGLSSIKLLGLIQTHWHTAVT